MKNLIKLLPILFLLVAGCLPAQSPPEDEEAFSPVTSSPPMFFKQVESKPRAKTKDQPPVQPQINPRPTLRLVSADREALYRSFFPKTDDPKTNALKDQVSFYDEESIPRVYQVWDQGQQSGLRSTAGGQRTANNEFPWAGPAGTVANDNHKTIRFVRLENPIQWFRAARNDGTFDGFKWDFPVGTTFGEILLVTDPEGNDHTAELRTRRKNSEGDWTTNAFRPFPKEKGFRDALLERGFDFLASGPIPERVNSGQQNRPFIASANFERLPTMSSSLVASLLDGSTFESARHKKWSEVADGPTAQGFSVVPTNFIGGFIPVNGESCARCHEDVGKVVNLTGDTRWRLRGSDRIFTFHPFAPDSLGRDIRFNQKLVEAGLLVHKPGAP